MRPPPSIDRRWLLAGALAAALGGRRAGAQPRRKRIGWLVFGATLGPSEQAVRDEVAVTAPAAEIDFRYAKGDARQLAALAAELVAARPDLLVGIGGDIVAALRFASATLPVVGAMSENPVRAGHAESLARPGKNFTGATFITDEMAGKRLEVLKEAAPRLGRVAVLWNPQHFDDEMSYLREAAGQIGVGLTSHELHALEGLDAALEGAAAAGAEALFVIPSRLTILARDRIAAAAREQRWPSIAAWREFALSGCLLSYGPNVAKEARKIGADVARILAGAAPGELPISRPATFELVVNQRTAASIGLELPPALVDRADKVIE